MRRSRLSLPVLLAAIFFSLGGRPAAAAPAHVLVTVPSGAASGNRLEAQLAGWRQTGVLSSVVMLDSGGGKEVGFAAFAVLEFPDEDTLERWQKAGARELGPGVLATRADAIIHGESSPRDSSKARFLVALYRRDRAARALRGVRAGIRGSPDGRMASRARPDQLRPLRRARARRCPLPFGPDDGVPRRPGSRPPRRGEGRSPPETRPQRCRLEGPQ